MTVKQPKPERRWTSEQLLAAMRPRHKDWHNVYVIGCYDRRITFYNQQVRALCLVAALSEQGKVQGRRVAVIGGGAAGSMAALAACHAGAEQVTLLERAPVLLHLQAMSNRLLHPHLYDWPAPGSHDPRAGLPLLDWEAGEAENVVNKLRPEIQHERLRIRTAREQRNDVQGIEPDRDEVILHIGSTDRECFDLTLVAVGFGTDESRTVPPTNAAYWESDSLETMQGKRILVSGAGDGGLIDLARACFVEFRHHRILELLDALGDTQVLGELLQRECPPYRDCQQHVTATQKERVQYYTTGRKNTVFFNPPTREVFQSSSAPINRLLALLLCSAHVAAIIPGQLTIEYSPGGKRIARITDPTTKKSQEVEADYIVTRHGPRHKGGQRFIEHDLPSLADVCAEMGGTLADLRINEVLDRETYDFFAGLKAKRKGTTAPPIHAQGQGQQTEESALSHGMTEQPLGSVENVENSSVEGLFSSQTGHQSLRARDYQDHPEFENLLIWWRNFGQRNRGTSDAAYSPSNPTFNVPYAAKAEYLVGRAGLLEMIRQQLLNGRPTSIGRTASFQGIGGLGKTQIAVDYAHHYRHEYPSGVLWLEADRDVDTQLIQIADAAGWIAPQSEHRDKLALARQRLRTFAGGLVVLDNLRSLADIKDYLPACNVDVHILVTTPMEQPGFTPLALDLLGEDDTMRMLVQEAGREPVCEAEWSAARAIARRLDGLPLAIELAGALLRYRSALTWQEYHATLEADVPGALPGGEFRHVSNTKHVTDLRATLHVSEQVLASAPCLGAILDLLTWSGSAAMGTSLIAALLDVDVTSLQTDLALGAELRLLVEDKEQSNVASGRRWRIHRLVRDVRRGERRLDAAWGRIICQRLGTWFEARREDFSDLPAFEIEIDHLAVWRTHAESASPSWPECVRLTWLQAYPADHHGNYAEAKAWVQQALSLYTNVGNNDPVLEAHLQNDLGGCYGNLGLFQEALARRQRGLVTRQAILGDEHPDTARSLLNVGVVHLWLGGHEQALVFTRQALAIQSKILEPNHIDISATYNTLGTIYAERGNSQTSLYYLTQALEICRQAHGPEHPRTLGVLGNISAVYNELGRHEEALKHQEQVLAVQHSILGPEHPDYALTLGRIADSYRELGNYTQALEHRRRALKIQLRILSSKHPQTAQSFSNIGTIYDGLGKHAKALIYKKKALSIRQKVLGAEHPDTAASLGTLGTTYNSLGEHDQALECYKDALAIERMVFGPQCLRSATTLSNIGSTYQALRKPEQALPHFRDGLFILRKHRDKGHPDAIFVLVTAARCVAQIGSRTRRNIHEQIFEWLRETLGALSKDHSQYAELVSLCRAITPSGRRPIARSGPKANRRNGKRRTKRR